MSNHTSPRRGEAGRGGNPRIEERADSLSCPLSRLQVLRDQRFPPHLTSPLRGEGPFASGERDRTVISLSTSSGLMKVCSAPARSASLSRCEEQPVTTQT